MALLGSPGKVRMLKVFLGKHYEELSAAQVADLAGIDASTFHRNVDIFLDAGVVTESRTVGGAQLYRLDADHPVARALGRARSSLLEHAEDVDRSAPGEKGLGRDAPADEAGNRHATGFDPNPS